MKRLIKQISYLPGGINHLGKVFPNSLNCFYHLTDSIHFRLFTEILFPIRTNSEIIPVGFFLNLTHLKIKQ